MSTEAAKTSSKTVDFALHAKIWGISMISFSVLFLLGTITGGWFRYTWETRLTLPWTTDDDIPESPEEAWSWITFSRDALDMGLPAVDIRAIYRKSGGIINDGETPPPWPSYSSRAPKSAENGAAAPSPKPDQPEPPSSLPRPTPAPL